MVGECLTGVGADGREGEGEGLPVGAGPGCCLMGSLPGGPRLAGGGAGLLPGGGPEELVGGGKGLPGTGCE